MKILDPYEKMRVLDSYERICAFTDRAFLPRPKDNCHICGDEFEKDPRSDRQFCVGCSQIVICRDCGAAFTKTKPGPKRCYMCEEERKASLVSKQTRAYLDRWQIFNRDGFQCVYCGTASTDGARLVLDHVHPHSRSGTDTADNLVTACSRCNSSKHAEVLSGDSLNRILNYITNKNNELGIDGQTIIKGSHQR